MKTSIIFTCAIVVGCATSPAHKSTSSTTNPDIEAKAMKVVKDITAKAAPLEKASNLAYWKATTTGDKDSYAKVEKLEIALRQLYSNKEQYELLKKARDSGLSDPLLARQIVLLVNAMEENQIDEASRKRMVALSTKVQKTFSEFRGKMGGKELADNEIKDILRKDKDSAKLKAAWEAYKQKGKAVAPDIIELIKLRNKAARSRGYKDYYQMRLQLQEQDPKEIKAIFDKLAGLTDEPFRKIKAKVDEELAKRYGVDVDKLMPWHYQDPFFQESPKLKGVDLDSFFADKDPLKIVQGFYTSIGLDPADILKHSDLYEKPGKMPHAYCTNMDRSGDIRILANLRPNEQWTSTLMHEMGHGVYDLYTNKKLPWLLRQPAHAFTTEAIAMMFGRQTRNPAWLIKAAGVDPEKVRAVEKDITFNQRLGMLVFARWAMVMMNFEREMYANPDQDLNKLWWDLKERYQLLHRPEGRDAPDWASKIHIAVWPAYYHNYLLGECMASQVLDYLAKNIVKSDDPNHMDMYGNKNVGSYLKEKIFGPGASMRWDELLRTATGDTLNPGFFAQQFID